MNNPFTLALIEYLAVFGIASLAGLVRHINKIHQIRWGALLIDVITSAFTGLVTFWICQANSISPHWTNVCIAITGWMGTRAWSEFEAVLKAKIMNGTHSQQPPYMPPYNPQPPPDDVPDVPGEEPPPSDTQPK